MIQPVRFFVPGIPAPKGSARAFFVKNLNRAVITNANAKTKPWEQAIRAEAHAAEGIAGCAPHTAAVRVTATFYFPRPKGHFGAKGLKPAAPRENTKKPDLDKLARALLDALTGIAFVDDSQVIDLRVEKRYVPNDGSQPGMAVEIVPAELVASQEAARG